MAQAGVTLPRTSFDQFGVGTPVDRASIQAGDLVFFNAAGPGASHVAIATSNATAISATTKGVMEHPIGGVLLGRALRGRAPHVIEGDPGAPFEDEVLVRRLRWASDETGFAVIDAERDGDDIVLVGPIAHLEERERVRVRGVWQDDKRFGMQVKVSLAEPVAPSGEAALMAYLKRVKHVGGARAARLLERYGDDVLEAIDATRRRRSASIGFSPEARQRGDPLVERAALDARAAPAARAARAGVARPADRRRVRRPRARRWCGRGRTS